MAAWIVKEPTMRPSACLLALATFCCAGHAAADDLNCEVHSDYDHTVNAQSVIFTRASGTPKAIVMRDGRLFADGAWRELSAADSRRIAAFERGVRKAVPQVLQIGQDAAEIAFIALGEVAVGFSDEPRQTRAKLDRAKARLDAELARSVSTRNFESAALGDAVAEAMGDVLPIVIGDIVGGAIAAAFSGDSARLQRMEHIDAELEARIEPAAEQLERRGEALCRQLAALDRIDDALEVRIDGRPLNLLEAEVGRTDTPQ